MTYFKLKSKKLLKLGLISVVSIFLFTGLVTGCTANNNQGTVPEPAIEKPQIDEKAIMDSYKKLTANNAQPQEIFEFLNENAKVLSKENLGLIIAELENLQKVYLPKIEDKYYASQEIQIELGKLYQAKKDINDLKNAESEALKSLLTETNKSGYKIETAEGMFFPIVNYSAYKNYAQYLSEDLKSYIEIMTMESDRVPAKDGALVIGWDEVIERALKQEAFIKQYTDSSKLEGVKELHKRYLYFTFFGLNNTPLFNYDGNIMTEDAKTTYSKIDFSSGDSELKQKLKGYMELLEKSNYKLTPEIDRYRKGIIEKL